VVRPQFVKTWNLRNVVQEKLKETINAKILAKTGAGPGDDGYLKSYPAALTETIHELTPEQRGDYQKLADDWNNAIMPNDVRRR
jgi:hypothetical protein